MFAVQVGQSPFVACGLDEDEEELDELLDDDELELLDEEDDEELLDDEELELLEDEELLDDDELELLEGELELLEDEEELDELLDDGKLELLEDEDGMLDDELELDVSAANALAALGLPGVSAMKFPHLRALEAY
jgi:hypothetical protein